jgi:hypothetical protein
VGDPGGVPDDGEEEAGWLADQQAGAAPLIDRFLSEEAPLGGQLLLWGEAPLGGQLLLWWRGAVRRTVAMHVLSALSARPGFRPRVLVSVPASRFPSPRPGFRPSRPGFRPFVGALIARRRKRAINPAEVSCLAFRWCSTLTERLAGRTPGLGEGEG